MKKSKLLKLLSGAMLFIAAMGFTSCVDDNDDQMPYLEVTPQVLKFDANGTAIGASEFIVKSNRPWTLDIPAEASWVRPSVTQGEGDGTVSFNLFASNVGQRAELTFSLKNSAGFAYTTVKVTIEQGDAPKPGPVGELVQWIIDNNPAKGPLNYPVEEIEAVILANNQYGNNFGKLYVGDNTTLPNSGMILYSTSEYNKANSVNYPVGKRVKLNLANAEYAPYQNLRELKDVQVTVLDGDPVEIVVPTLSASTFLEGKYQGQYVKVLNVTPQAAYVGQAWATDSKRAVKMTAEGGAELQSYMATATDATDFATMIIADKTGAIYGAAEQIGSTIQIIPTKPEDVAELSVGGDQPAVSTGAATNLTATSVTLAGSSRNIDAASEVGVEYKIATATEWTKKAAAAAAAEWTVDIDGLTADTKYAYRAYAVAAGQTYYGAEDSFTTKGTSDADIYIDFTDLSGYPAGFPTKKGTADLATYKFGGYDFTFFGVINGTGDKAKGGYYSSTYDNATVLIWGQDGAYIGLPAIAGKSLTKVVCTVPDGASAAVQVGVFDAAGQPVTGGEAITWSKEAGVPRVYTYNLSGTAANTSYRLQVISKHNSQLAELELYYSEGSTPEQPSLSPAKATMEFAAAADATGKTQVYELKNATGLTLFADVADKTNFSAAVENGNTVRVKTLTANDGTARTTTVTAYLAESATSEKKATATINVTQKGSAPVTTGTIAQFRTAAKSVATKEGAAMTDIIGQSFAGYIVANNVDNNLYKMLAVADNTTAGNSGILLFGDAYNTITNYPVGKKITITVTANSKAKLYNGMLEIEGVTTEVSPTESITVNPVVLTLDQFLTNEYEGMYVKITGLKFKGTTSEPWFSGTGNYARRTFTNGSKDLTTSVYKTVSFANTMISTTVENAALSGVGESYNGTAQLYPQTAADVAAFSSTEPTITGLNPSSLSWEYNATDARDVAATVVNQNGAALSVNSAEIAPFTATVNGTTITVTPPQAANETDMDIVKTLTVSIAGGNSMNVTLTQKKKPQGGGGDVAGAEWTYSLQKDDLVAGGATTTWNNLSWTYAFDPENTTLSFVGGKSLRYQIGGKIDGVRQDPKTVTFSTSGYTEGIQSIRLAAAKNGTSQVMNLKIYVGDNLVVDTDNVPTKPSSGTDTPEETYTFDTVYSGALRIVYTNAKDGNEAGIFIIKTITINPAQ